jgi:large subunit ribosomal protein L21
MDYAVCLIAGRQYIVRPNQIIEVNKLSHKAEENFTVDTVLLMVNGDKVSVGAPYLKDTLEFEHLGLVKDKKIRVATYKAKSNYHRVIGSRAQKSRIRLVEKSVKKA